MIDFFDKVGDMPPLLYGLCYIGGMAIYLAMVYWLACKAGGRDSDLSLRQMCIIWLARVLVAFAVISIGMMVVTGQLVQSPLRAAPEVSILLLLAALYLLIEKRRFLNRRHILTRRLPGEIVKIVVVTLVATGAFGMMIYVLKMVGSVNEAAGGPEWVPFFAAGATGLAAPVALFIIIRERNVVENLRFYYLLAPMVVACGLIMLPHFIEHLSESPKIDEFLHARGYLQRAESFTGKHNPPA